MNVKRATVDLNPGEWIMIPPGRGKHRGRADDSGILVVEDIWVGAKQTSIKLADLADGYQVMRLIDNIVGGEYCMVEVVQ